MTPPETRPETRPETPAAPPAETAAALEAWFASAARDLPWRRPPAEGPLRRDPYATLVSELMLQQTQVSRVVEKFAAFVRAFPTLADLAAADEQNVLAAWSGLGYYRRARLLHAAAKAAAERHGGRVPGTHAELLALPGVGRYTAGAVSSLAFGLAEPAVDGNVTRVLLRLDGLDLDPAAPATARTVGARAAGLVRTASDPGSLNEAIMELGATVCTPRNPDCARCPLANGCVARAEGRQAEIPRPKAAPKKRPLYAAVLRAVRPDGALLVEQRPPTGLWASMWQAPTLERDDRPATADELAARSGVPVRTAEAFDHQTSHRAVRFAVFDAEAEPDPGRLTPGGAPAPDWQTPARVASLAISNPQRKILLGDAESLFADS